MNSNEKIIPKKDEEIKNPEVHNIEGEALGDNSIFFGVPVDKKVNLEDRKELDKKIALLLESIKKDIK